MQIPKGMCFFVDSSHVACSDPDSNELDKEALQSKIRNCARDAFT